MPHARFCFRYLSLHVHPAVIKRLFGVTLVLPFERQNELLSLINIFFR